MKIWYRTDTMKPHILQVFKAIDHTPRTLKELRELTGISKTSVQEAIEYLSGAGLVIRRGDQNAVFYKAGWARES